MCCHIHSAHADGIFIPYDDLENAIAFSKELRRRVRLEGRSPNDFIITPSHNPIVGRTEKEAEEKFQELQSLMPSYRIPKPKFFGSAEKVADQIQHWYEAEFDQVDTLLTQPLLLVAGSEAGTRWQSEQVYELAKGPKELVILEGGNHFDLYDIPEYVDQAVTKMTEFFCNYLS